MYGTDDFDKRYYSPDDDDIPDTESAVEPDDHYYSPLDENVEEEDILPFSHVDFDDDPSDRADTSDDTESDRSGIETDLSNEKSASDDEEREDEVRYYLVGSMTGWAEESGYELTAASGAGRAVARLKGVELSEGDEVKIKGVFSGGEKWIEWDCGADDIDYIEFDEYGNAVIFEDGVFDITLSVSGSGGIVKVADAYGSSEDEANAEDEENAEDDFGVPEGSETDEECATESPVEETEETDGEFIGADGVIEETAEETEEIDGEVENEETDEYGFTEDEIKDAYDDLSVFDPADTSGEDSGVFDKKSEFLFSDDYPEEPESLGKAGAESQSGFVGVKGFPYNEHSIEETIIPDDKAIDQGFFADAEEEQISFSDLGDNTADEPFIVRESFFDEKPSCADNSEKTLSDEEDTDETESFDRGIDAENVEESEPTTEVAETEPQSDREVGEPIAEDLPQEDAGETAGSAKNTSAKTENDNSVDKDVRRDYMFIEDESMNVAKIMVIGVGGAGNNAVNRMIEKNVNTATFVALNTDRQALLRSKCPLENRFQIGIQETKGLGAGSNPEVGERAAEESRALIEQLVDGVDLLFIAAGMGGGTGTGAAPVIAKIAREKGCVTVAVVTKPFDIEGRKRALNAEKGIVNLKKYVDTIIIIPNDKLMEALRPDTPLVDALLFADDTLRQGICGIADLIATNALINLDFADVRTVLKDQGLAHMGIGRAKGENRVMEAVKDAVCSPLLETTIEGARGIILNVTGGEDMTLGQVYEASRQVQNIVDPSANIILGMNIDKSLSEELVITLIATGFDRTDDEEEETESTAQARAYKNLFTPKPESEPVQESIVSDPVDIMPEDNEPEQAEQPKKELPPFMRRLFKK